MFYVAASRVDTPLTAPTFKKKWVKKIGSIWRNNLFEQTRRVEAYWAISIKNTERSG